MLRLTCFIYMCVLCAVMAAACSPRPESSSGTGVIIEPKAADGAAKDNTDKDNTDSNHMVGGSNASALDKRQVFADAWLSVMTPEEKIGQLLMCRLPSGTLTVTDEVKRFVESNHLGGVILFSENIHSIEQVQTLTADLQSLAAVPLLISTDEEGGHVSRTGVLYEEKIPYAYDLGESGDTNAVYDSMLTVGRRLKQLGINMDFAPVCDIWSNDVNTVIGKRAYGRDPETAAVMAGAAVRGLKDAGVLSVAKHFPGHGDTAEDSHMDIAMYNYDRSRFDAFESIPFTRVIEAGVDGVMVGHIAAPQITAGEHPVLEWMAPWLEEGRLPAVFSKYLTQDVLRGEMGFGGLVITDGLEMRALTDSFTDEQIALGAFMAGADILLIPLRPERAYAALLDAYHSGVFDDERLDASVRRILYAKACVISGEV